MSTKIVSADLLEHARALTGRRDSELAVLRLLIGYFESHAMYLRGQDSKGQSETFFVAGFRDVFSVAESLTAGISVPPGFHDDLAKTLYQDGRCGLSHDAVTRGRIMVSYHGRMPIGVSFNRRVGEVEAVVINPRLWVGEIETHLAQYLRKLRDPANAELRNRFATLFVLKNPPGRVIHFPPEMLNFMEPPTTEPA